MRTKTILIAILLLALCGWAGAATPDELLQRGQENYRAGKYNEAITDLRGAADALLTPEQMRAYVNTGQFASLPKFETAVVYLAMSYAKLGRDSEAGEQIHRLNVAEAIVPTYAKLPLTADVAGFDDLVARVAPGTKLAPNAALAALKTAKPAPAPQQQVAQSAPPQPKAPSDERAEQARIIEERVAAERAIIEREAQEKIAAAQAEAQKTIEQRVAEERAAIEKAAEERIAAERKKIEEEAAKQIAQAREEAQIRANEQIAAAQPQPQPQPAPMRPTENATIQQANAWAESGHAEEANATYARIAANPDSSRESVIEAAIGLYRTGDFSDAARAFDRLSNFMKGEEDLRYYKAVSLFEIGRFAEAKKELACALPYIQATNEVLRYREKIEAMQ